MTFNAATGLMSWRPTNAQAGPHAVSVQAKDSVNKLVGVQTFVLEVLSTRVAASQFVSAAAGGSLTVEGTGTVLDGAIIEVPPESLPFDETVQVALVEGNLTLGDSASILGQPMVLIPDRPFKKGVSVTLPSADTLALPGLSVENLRFATVFSVSTPLITSAFDYKQWVLSPLLSILRPLFFTPYVQPGGPLVVQEVPGTGQVVALTPDGELTTLTSWPAPLAQHFILLQDLSAGQTGNAEGLNRTLEALVTVESLYRALGFPISPTNIIEVHVHQSGAAGGVVHPFAPHQIHLNDALLEPARAGDLQVAAAHEYFHVIQQTMLGCPACRPAHGSNGWFGEGSAAFMMDEVFDAGNWHHQLFPWNASVTEFPLEAPMQAQGQPYRMMQFFKFLDTMHPDFSMADLWAAAQQTVQQTLIGDSVSILNEPHGAAMLLDQYLQTRFGTSLAEEYLDFVYAFNAGRRDDMIEEISQLVPFMQTCGEFDCSPVEPPTFPLSGDQPSVRPWNGRRTPGLSGQTFVVDVAPCLAGKDILLKSSGGAKGHAFVLGPGEPMPHIRQLPPGSLKLFSPNSPTVNLGDAAGKRVVVTAINPDLTGVKTFTIDVYAKDPSDPIDCGSKLSLSVEAVRSYLGGRAGQTQSVSVSAPVMSSRTLSAHHDEQFDSYHWTADAQATAGSGGVQVSGSSFSADDNAFSNARSSASASWSVVVDAAALKGLVPEGQDGIDVTLFFSATHSVQVQQTGTSIIDQAIANASAGVSITCSACVPSSMSKSGEDNWFYHGFHGINDHSDTLGGGFAFSLRVRPPAAGTVSFSLSAKAGTLAMNLGGKAPGRAPSTANVSLSGSGPGFITRASDGATLESLGVAHHSCPHVVNWCGAPSP